MYLKRLSLYLEANGRKVAVLLTVMEPKAHGVLKSLLSSMLPKRQVNGQAGRSLEVALRSKAIRNRWMISQFYQ